MVPIAYASSGGSDELDHPRKIASALTAHIHNEGAWRGCEGALAIRRIFSLVDMIKKPKLSNCPNVFEIGLFR